MDNLLAFADSSIESRTIDLACYMIENKTTIREAAAKFGISKSVAHEDLSYRLPSLNPALYAELRPLLDQNFAERQIRGGRAKQRILREQKAARRVDL